MKKLTKKQKYYFSVIGIFLILFAIVQFLHTGGYMATDDYQWAIQILLNTATWTFVITLKN